MLPVLHRRLSGKGPASGHVEVSGGLCASHSLPEQKRPPMVSPPEAEHSAALGIRGEETDRPSRDPELMLVLNWEINASCGPLPGGTKQPSGQCPGQQLDKPKDTVYTWLFSSRFSSDNVYFSS